MLFLELQNKAQIDAAPNTVLQAQISGETNRGRQLQARVGMMQQEAEATQQELKSVADTTKRIDPKISVLNHSLDVAATDLGSRVATVKDSARQMAGRIVSLEVKVDQTLVNTLALSSELASTKQTSQAQLDRFGEDLEETKNLAHAAQATTRRQASQLQGHLDVHDASILRFAEALSGNIKLYAEAIAANLSAAELNAAEVGTFTRDLTVSLVSEMGEGENTVRYVHPWALLPVVISSEVAADPDIDAAIVQDHDDPLATPQFVSGILRLMVIFDTDAGVTKTYAAEDELTVTVKISADSKLLGWPVVDFVMTYTVIA
jgi:predicted phage tail protein